MAAVRKRINKAGQVSYFVEIRKKGFPAQRSTFKKMSDAKAWASQIESDIQTGKIKTQIAASQHTLTETIDRYSKTILQQKKSAANQARQLNWWSDQIGVYALSEIKRDTIAQCRDKLLETKSAGTVTGYLAALSHLFTVAVNDWEWIDNNPVSRVSKPKLPKGRDRTLSDSEREKLLHACKLSSNKYLYTIVVLALSTGMRKSEILNLRWSDIDISKNQIILRDTKNGDKRNVPLFDKALELVKALKQTSNTELLFPGRNKAKPVLIDVPFVAAVKAANIDNFTFHDLRHSAATYALQSGAGYVELAALLGHKTLDMVKRYAHVTPNHAASIVQNMNSKIFK